MAVLTLSIARMSRNGCLPLSPNSDKTLSLSTYAMISDRGMGPPGIHRLGIFSIADLSTGEVGFAHADHDNSP